MSGGSSRTTTVWRWLGAGAVLVVAVGLAVRSVVRAAGTETGWETIGLQWRGATFGWFVGRETPLPQREPAEQADFWLREVERIVGSPEKSARLCIGAAWILDRPADDFRARYLRPRDEEWAQALLPPELDEQAVTRARQAFESKCATRCLELAGAATRLEPGNPDWWRTRALLSFVPGELSKGAWTPRDPDRWLDVLHECAKHDPDNALYDYLAALHLWASSAEYYDRTSGDLRLEVHEADSFARGDEQFQRGQTKGMLAFGLNVHRPLVDVLEQSRLPRLQHPAVARSQDFPAGAQSVLVALDRWLIARQNKREAEETPADALVVLRERGKVFEQFGRVGSLQELHLRVWANGLWRSYLWGIRHFAAEHEKVLTQAQLAELRTNERRVLTGEAVLQQAALRLGHTPTPKDSFGEVLPAVLAGTALWSAVVTTLAAVIAWGVLLLAARRNDTTARVHPFGLALAWVAAYAVSWLVLGALPAGLGGMSGMVGGLVLYVLACVPLVALGTWLVCRLSRWVLPEKPPRTVVTVAAALILSRCCLTYAESFVRSFEPRRWLPARGGDVWSDSALRDVMRVEEASWQWSIYQWLAYYGPMVAPVVAVVFVGLWHGWREGRRGEGRERWRGVMRSVRTSLVMAAVFFLVTYLAAAPAEIERAEAEYQDAMRYVRDPEKHWATLDAAIAEVEVDEAVMRSIREDAESLIEEEGAP